MKNAALVIPVVIEAVFDSSQVRPVFGSCVPLPQKTCEAGTNCRGHDAWKVDWRLLDQLELENAGRK